MNEVPVARPRSRFPWVGFFRTLVLLPIVLVALASGFVWFALPALAKPSQPIAVASPAPEDLLDRKVEQAAPRLLLGQETTITVTEAEAASLLAAGFMDDTGLQIAGLSMQSSRLVLHVVVTPELPPEVPPRFGGPWGVTFDLQTLYLPDGRIRAELTDVHLGRIPVPLILVRWVLVQGDLGDGPLDPLLLTAEVDAGLAVAESFDGQAHLKDWRFEEGKMTLVIAPGQRS